MAVFQATLLKVATLIRWDADRELLLQPKFQRRLSWKLEARAYLIDTIIRGLPMPKVYLRRSYSRERERNVFEVVDGQQRLASILQFWDNDLKLNSKHNAEFGGLLFEELPEPVQRQFLEYELSAEIMEDATDREVWGMFERLNTYTLTLNPQETRNARFFGYFKQAAYQLAAEQTELGLWRRLRVFSNVQIARMKEVQMTSDVLAAVVTGIRDAGHLNRIYKDLDEDFPQQERASAVVRSAMGFVSGAIDSGVSSTRFKNQAWFYSLVVAVADSLVGIPNGTGPSEMLSGTEIEGRMKVLDKALSQEEVPEPLAGLKSALLRSTGHVPERLRRHRHFFRMLALPGSAWWNNSHDLLG